MFLDDILVGQTEVKQSQAYDNSSVIKRIAAKRIIIITKGGLKRNIRTVQLQNGPSL